VRRSGTNRVALAKTISKKRNGRRKASGDDREVSVRYRGSPLVDRNLERSYAALRKNKEKENPSCDSTRGLQKFGIYYTKRDERGGGGGKNPKEATKGCGANEKNRGVNGKRDGATPAVKGKVVPLIECPATMCETDDQDSGTSRK